MFVGTYCTSLNDPFFHNILCCPDKDVVFHLSVNGTKYDEAEKYSPFLDKRRVGLWTR